MFKTLVVEDNAVFRYAVRTMVDEAGCGFRVAAEAVNGKQALDLMKDEQFDLILSDVSMPEMNGIDLLREVKRQSPEIMFIILSGYDDFKYVKEAWKIGAEDYLLKHELEPAAMQTMLAQIGRRLGEKAQSSACGTEPDAVADGSGCRKEIRQAIAYIRDHYAEEITIGRLADRLGFSANYLSGLFRSETGYRLKEYVNRVRIDAAKRLLGGTNLKVYEVAERVGFHDCSYFCKLFKETTGETVSEYKNRG